MNRRSMIGLAAAAVTLGLAALPPAASAGGVSGKPTVVLVHGAFADSSSWNGVIQRLQRAGYPVLSASNPLRGLEPDAAYVRSVLDSVKGPIVLAGHSYGGAVISAAAVDHPQVKALVYIAAVIPDRGESTGELTTRFPGNTLGQNLLRVPFPLPGGGTGTDLYVKPSAFHRHFAADVPAGTAALLAATQRPAATTALEEKATKTAWRTIASWALLATEDRAIPLAAQRFMAERAGSRTIEVKASHAVAVSQPDRVAKIIFDAARSES
ncbi:alpha/beta hydrolase [Spongiactinospora sp. TRM90649]|uniref:alpha/beta fold hydrolase n=1 Tax=Spongiactinospora sp. TRM90649 TaxID=3031114 RepID=UPI0023F6CD85|nr:alpha/beta hydrolase [Spongiactinospora sp. TRM90649]MDF5758045.1 alpha/beta hydrolase [Spongiactinospora sp. TRM90649]